MLLRVYISTRISIRCAKYLKLRQNAWFSPPETERRLLAIQPLVQQSSGQGLEITHIMKQLGIQLMDGVLGSNQVYQCMQAVVRVHTRKHMGTDCRRITATYKEQKHKNCINFCNVSPPHIHFTCCQGNNNCYPINLCVYFYSICIFLNLKLSLTLHTHFESSLDNIF